jgi:enterochelin esterase-like enzyme
MSLTGPIFLNGIIVLTLAAFLAVIWIWPRLTAGTPWHVAGRVGALVLVNFLVLLTAATQLNANYLFFAGWADLKGALTGHVAQTSLHRGGAERTAPGISVAGNAAPVSVNPPALKSPIGASRLLKYTVHGARSGLTGTILIHLPPGYKSTGHRRYPVLEAFHGYPSAPHSWIKNFHLQQITDQLTRSHQLKPTLIVMPQIEIPQGVDTEGVNGPRGTPQVETWLTKDVPDWVGQYFRVIANRNAWATIGDSAGGYVSAMATIHNPAQYSAAIVLGGYFRPDFGPFYVPFAPKSPRGRYYELPRYVAHNPPPVAVWLETSHADVLSYSTSAQFLRATRKPTAVHAVVLQNAGHRDSVWVALEPQALRWLGRNVAGFHP